MLYISYILAGCIAVLIFWILRLEIRLGKFWKGKKGADIEGAVQELKQHIESMAKDQHDMGNHIIHLDAKIKKSIRGVETVRFNPFKDQGSNQSFAIALVNDDGDGVVLSSLYSRERVSIFAKPVKKANSEFELSHEEKEAVKIALNNTKS